MGTPDQNLERSLAALEWAVPGFEYYSTIDPHPEAVAVLGAAELSTDELIQAVTKAIKEPADQAAALWSLSTARGNMLQEGETKDSAMRAAVELACAGNRVLSEAAREREALYGFNY